jgi:hypothetical protein
MRACAPCADIAIEIDVECCVELEAVLVDVDHMNLVIALPVYDATRREVFDQKVVRPTRRSRRS